jgi:hypothetical protein
MKREITDHFHGIFGNEGKPSGEESTEVMREWQWMKEFTIVLIE